MKFEKKDLFTIPNILTYIRFLCVPLFVWLALDKSVQNATIPMLYPFIVFMFASITDLCDGYIARHFNQVSDIGKVLDPLADKILQVTTMIILAVFGYIHWAFAIIMLVKELYMVCGAGILLLKVKEKVNVQSNYWGKAAAFSYGIGIILAFFHIEKLKNLFYIDWVILGLGCVLTIIAAVNYTIQMVKEIKNFNGKQAVSVATNSETQNAETQNAETQNNENNK
ncbi:MAG: CDP-diacylglycerol--glycerol-3-phosphate 3-phosphatidyltransferase [Clostridia bacterium]